MNITLTPDPDVDDELGSVRTLVCECLEEDMDVDYISIENLDAEHERAEGASPPPPIGSDSWRWSGHPATSRNVAILWRNQIVEGFWHMCKWYRVGDSHPLREDEVICWRFIKDRDTCPSLRRYEWRWHSRAEVGNPSLSDPVLFWSEEHGFSLALKGSTHWARVPDGWHSVHSNWCTGDDLYLEACRDQQSLHIAGVGKTDALFEVAFWQELPKAPF
jgi:hypothetical protein